MSSQRTRITSVEFVVTPEFLQAYGRLDAVEAECLDRAIQRLVRDPSTAWARGHRVAGERDTAWIVVVPCPACDLKLYWNRPDPHGPVQLLLLLRR